MEELTLACYGVEVHLRDTAGLALCQRLRDSLPPEFAAPTDPPQARVAYAVSAASVDYRVTRDGLEVFTTDTDEDLFGWLSQDIDRTVARHSQRLLFVHAGVVGWRGLAIVIPGRSHTGKSTLVAELVRRGAVYYSDEFAVLDEAGRVHPYRRALVLRDDRGQPRDLRLVREDTPTDPLPLGLIVAGPYQPGATWRPTVLGGAQTVLPLLDGTVLARQEAARALRLAAGLAPTVVTLQGPRPEATEIAPQLLDLVDDAFVSHALGANQHAASPLADDLTRVAEQRLRAQISRPASPARRLLAARYVRVTDFLSPEEHRRVLEHALACEDDFAASGIIGPQGKGLVDHGFRRSRTVSGPRLEEIWELFDQRLRGILPAVRQELEIPWFPLGQVERQLTAHGSGGFFAPHVDTGDPAVANRRISCIYYFYTSPRRFTGGELKLYDTWITPTGSTGAGTYTTLTPLDNSLVFFPSDAFHEVCPVYPETDAFADCRFAVTIWFREGERPAELDRAVAQT
jgi:hypothetical protein